MSELIRNLDAERNMLAAVLADPGQADRLLESVTPDDLYQPNHGELWTVIGDMRRNDQPTDPARVMSELYRLSLAAKHGSLVADLTTRTVAVGTQAGYYAALVVQAARQREIQQLAQRLEDRAGNPDADPDALLDILDADTLRLRRARINPDVLPPTMDDLADRDNTKSWVVPDLIADHDRVITVAHEGHGKALDVTTPIPTLKGWLTMGELSVGDEVFRPDGSPVRIIAATDVMSDRPCYRVRFSDGAEIVADANHLWLTETVFAREAASAARRRGPTKVRGTDQRHKRRHWPSVVTTEEMRATLRARDGHVLNHSVRVCEPLQYPAQELPVDPYVLGAWLGDGNSRCAELTSADDEIPGYIRDAGEFCRKMPGQPYQYAMRSTERNSRSPHSLQARLRQLGVLRNKHIPQRYAEASVEQRVALLQGLMDTDGTVCGTGSRAGRGAGSADCEFSVCSEQLARDVYHLLLGLGIKVRWRSSPAVLNGRTVGTRYRLQFITDLRVFRLKRKAERQTPMRTQRANLRYVVAVDPVESVPVRCIQVEHEDGMFLAGRECIATHNSVLMFQVAASVAAGLHPFTREPTAPHQVLVVDCENDPDAVSDRSRTLLKACIASGSHPGDRLRYVERPEGLELINPTDSAWLSRLVTQVQPKLLAIGPLYRLTEQDLAKEEPSRAVMAALDRARVRGNCALLMEAHVGNERQDGSRPFRPYGSSGWRRWAGIGMSMKPAADVPLSARIYKMTDYRGRRSSRDWPEFVAWDTRTDWPWRGMNAAQVAETKRLIQAGEKWSQR